MVEYAPSGRKHRLRQAGAGVPGAAAADDGRLYAAVRHPLDGPHPHSDPGTARNGSDAEGNRMNFDMSPYGAYIWPAYGVTVLALGGITVWSWLRWRRAKAKLAALESKT